MVMGRFLIFGLCNGGILVFDCTVTEVGTAVASNEIDKTDADTEAINMNCESVATEDKIIMRTVSVMPGWEPPLPRFTAVASSVEAVVKGYVCHTSSRRTPERSTLNSKSSDYINSSPQLQTAVHFIAAWADGRVCLCDIVCNDIDSVSDKEGSYPVYSWKTVRFIQTGLYLFCIECVHLQKNKEYSRQSGDLSKDSVLCLVASRTGETLFISRADFSDREVVGTGNTDMLPETVCCFESSSLLGGQVAMGDCAGTERLTESNIRKMLSENPSIMIRRFTVSKFFSSNICLIMYDG